MGGRSDLSQPSSLLAAPIATPGNHLGAMQPSARDKQLAALGWKLPKWAGTKIWLSKRVALRDSRQDPGSHAIIPQWLPAIVEERCRGDRSDRGTAAAFLMVLHQEQAWRVYLSGEQLDTFHHRRSGIRPRVERDPKTDRLLKLARRVGWARPF